MTQNADVESINAYVLGFERGKGSARFVVNFPWVFFFEAKKPFGAVIAICDCNEDFVRRFASSY